MIDDLICNIKTLDVPVLNKRIFIADEYHKNPYIPPSTKSVNPDDYFWFYTNITFQNGYVERLRDVYKKIND